VFVQTTSWRRGSALAVGLGLAVVLASGASSLAAPSTSPCGKASFKGWSAVGSWSKLVAAVPASPPTNPESLPIYLTGSITQDSGADLQIPAGVSLTLDLCGHDLSITKVAAGDAAIQLPAASSPTPGASLTVTDSSKGAHGKLTADGGAGSGDDGGGAGIGGSGAGDGGAVTVRSGTVAVTGGSSTGGGGGGAGIGGGGGELDAISGGGGGGDSLVTITSGIVNATGGAGSGPGGGGAGIGAGGSSEGSIYIPMLGTFTFPSGGAEAAAVTVGGGTVDATGGKGGTADGGGGGGAGIGGSGGSGVEATGGTMGGAASTVTLTGGSLDVRGGSNTVGGAAGIGAGGGGGDQTGLGVADPGSVSVSGHVSLAGEVAAALTVDAHATLKVGARTTLTLDGTGSVDTSSVVDLAGAIAGGGSLQNDGAITVSGKHWAIGTLGPSGSNAAFEITGNVFELTFGLAGGSGAKPADLWVLAPTLGQSGENLPAGPKKAPVKGQAFDSWQTGSGKVVSANTSLSPLSTDGVVALAARYAKSQTLRFRSHAPTHATVGGTYKPSVRASSKLPVTLTIAKSDQKVCSIAHGKVRFHKKGRCTISAAQAGNASYAPAASITQSFKVHYKPH
jgi:hypothetical protein